MIDSAELRRLAGYRSQMWVHRRLADGTLPAPIWIANRRYWRRRTILTLLGLSDDDENAA